MSRLFFIALLLMSSRALATVPCPSPPISAGFGQTFTETSMVGGFLWDSNHQFLYVMDLQQHYVTFIQVPQALAQRFSYTTSPDAFYTQNVQNSFHEAIEAENCQPLLGQNGNVLLSK